MKYVNTFMRSYRIIMEEKARQVEFMRKLQIEKILKEHNDRLNRMERKIEKN